MMYKFPSCVYTEKVANNRIPMSENCLAVLKQNLVRPVIPKGAGIGQSQFSQIPLVETSGNHDQCKLNCVIESGGNRASKRACHVAAQRVATDLRTSCEALIDAIESDISLLENEPNGRSGQP